MIKCKYNKYLENHANCEDRDFDEHGYGKKIPYVGWYWRDIDFGDIERIPIGDCGSFIGFMANNKWDYPERYLTKDEALTVIKMIDDAKAEKSGLNKIWKYMQTLKIESHP